MTSTTPRSVGVVGAGTMGAGIAQVAAQAGHDVFLYDVADGPLARGVDAIAEFLDAGVRRGKLARVDSDAVIARIHGTTDISRLAPSELVVEAAPEELAIKRTLFEKLSAVVAPDALLASNTSTLSIASIFANIPNPGRALGMHFFNPAPLMPLVEVIRGPATAPEAVRRALDVARAWGKHPVEVADTPGFVVNRVARPFYGEALQLLGEGVADVATIDRLVREGGFRMGPFELMDLIGIDVNFAAACSVYDGFFGDPRFRPHPIQRAMVDSGRLGRKSGSGYYEYGDSRSADAARTGVPTHGVTRLMVHGEPGEPLAGDLAARTGVPTHGVTRVMVLGEPGEPLAGDLAARFRAAGVDVVLDPGSSPPVGSSETMTVDAGIECTVVDQRSRTANLERLEHHLPAGAPILACCHATDATSVAAACARPRRVVGFGLLAPLADQRSVECSKGLRTDDAVAERAANVWRTIELEPTWIADSVGMVLPRVVACLVNEAWFALGEGCATAADIDRAMLLGTRYPRGPLAWSSLLGHHHVVATLDALAAAFGSERYRSAPLLRRMVTAGLLHDMGP